jgi:glycosyltransferase involved in cell wall biosynthesis
MKPKLSIILPTFNECKTNILDEILNSFLDLEDFELIVVDSNSEDLTVSSIQSFSLFKKSPEFLKIISKKIYL